MAPAAAPERAARKGAPWGLVFRGLGAVVALGILINTLARADLPHAAALLAHVGPWVAFVLVPFALAMALDTAAFRIVFRVLGHEATFRRLYMVRITAEAVTLSLPGGAVFAETLNPILLKRRCGVPFSESFVAATAKRWLIMRAQTAYIVVSVVIGYGTLVAASTSLIGRSGLQWIVLASALVPLVLSSFVASTLVGGTWAERLRLALRKIPIAALRKWLDHRHEHFAATDAGFGRLAGAARGRLHLPTLLLFGGWLLESVETWSILRLLGAPVSPFFTGFTHVIAFEAGLALVRNMAFFAPAGLGVQDLGYLAFFRALGFPDPTSIGAAFVVVKRAKEILWIVLGYVLLIVARRSAPVAMERGGR